MRALAVALVVAGCGARDADPGALADLQLIGGHFAAGALPAPSGGPAVESLQFSAAQVTAGQSDQPILGALAPSATAVLLALDGDAGYWIVGAGVPATDAPTFPTFSAIGAFSRLVPSGARTLVAEAVDAAGHIGSPATQRLLVSGVTLPAGPLVVHLGWNDAADLDLHVVDPDGVEIFFRHATGYQAPPPPALPDPNGPANAPLLDGDSNGGCAIDGREQENVVWTTAPKSGHYVVRVDAASLCGLPYADWRVDDVRDGAVVASARGEAVGSDTRGTHDSGSGRTALEFDVP
jgi:hypothetical protein